MKLKNLHKRIKKLEKELKEYKNKDFHSHCILCGKETDYSEHFLNVCDKHKGLTIPKFINEIKKYTQ